MRTVRRWFAETAGGLPGAFWVLFAGTLVNSVAGFVYPFLALYLSTERGMSPAFIGLVLGVQGAGSAVGVLVGGVLADRWGRRPTLFVGQLATAAALLGLGLSTDVVPLLVASTLFGVARNSVRPAFTAMMVDVVPERDRLRAFSLNYWAINLGFSVAALLAGAVAALDYLLLFAADAVSTLLAAVLVVALVAESRPRPVPMPVSPAPPGAPPPGGTLAAPGAPPRVTGLRAVLGDRVFMAFAAINVVVAGIFLQHASTLPIAMHADGISTQEYGAVIALNGVMIVLGQLAVGRVIDGRRRSRVLALSALLTGLGFGLCAFVGSTWAYALTVLVWTAGEMLGAPTATSVVADLSPTELRGRYQGVFSLSWSVASLVAPIAGGWVLQRGGDTALWLGCLALGALAALAHLAIAPARARRMAELRAAVGTRT